MHYGCQFSLLLPRPVCFYLIEQVQLCDQNTILFPEPSFLVSCLLMPIFHKALGDTEIAFFLLKFISEEKHIIQEPNLCQWQFSQNLRQALGVQVVRMGTGSG
jgi:hypothetical protein